MKRLACLVLVLLAGCPAAQPRLELPLRGDALERARRSLQARGEDPLAHRDLGWLDLLYGGRSRAALRSFEAALRRAPSEPAALLGRALALEGRGEMAVAVEAWAALLRAGQRQRGPTWSALRLLALQRLAIAGRAGFPLSLALLESLAADPDLLTRDRALALLVRELRHHGRAEELEPRARRRGCPAAWHVRGPRPGLPTIDLARALPDGSDTRRPTHACELSLHAREGAIFELGSAVVADGPAIVAVETSAPWLLLVDGATVRAEGAGETRPPGRVRLRLPWGAGRHQLALRVGVAGRAAVKLTVVTETGGAMRFEPPSTEERPLRKEPALEVTSLGCSADPGTLIAAQRWPDWYLPVARYLAASAARACRDLDLAYQHLRAAEAGAPDFAAARLLRINLLDRDPVISERVLAQRARPVLQRLLARDPELAGAALKLAGLALSLERYDEALELFRGGARRWPHQYQWQLGLQLVYRARSWQTEELAALQEARRLQPGSCELIEDLIALRRARREVGGLAALVEQAVGCDATSTARATLLRESGRLTDAAAELQRLLRLAPGSSRLRRDLGQLLLTAGRISEAAPLIEALVKDEGSPADRLMLADLRLAAGNRDGARRLLREEVERDPTVESLRQALERLEARSLVEDQRRDGLQVIAAYRRASKTYNAPAVLVQDRMVTRILPSGAKLMLVHNIIQVLSKEGIERWGEVRLPSRAEVLTLRSVKADGTTHEPEQVAGKRSVSLPDLEIGDFVEMEHLEVERPPRGYRGTSPQRFYFGSFDVPMVVSDYLVQVPVGMPITVETRGPAPRAERRERDGLLELHWVARDQGRLVVEPRSVSPDEYVPSVKIGAGASWERLHELVQEQAAMAFRLTEEVRERAGALKALRDPRRIAEAAYREVLETIDGAGPALSSASRAISRGLGSRHAALVALLRAAGIHAELWLIRPVIADQSMEVIPDPQLYQAPVVHCPLPGGAVFLDPRDPSIPFGYIAPELRGGQALRAAPGAVFERVPERSPAGEEERQIHASMQLRADGSARIEVAERLKGSMAILFRSLLRKAGVARMRKLFEHSALGVYFPGAALESVEFGDAKSGPYHLRYAFTSSGLARREGKGLQLSIGLFAPELARLYLGLARRERALQLAHHVPVGSDVVIKLPPGWRAGSLPSPVRVQTEFGRFHRAVSAEPEGRLRVRTTLDVAFRRVPPDRYPGFARFAREIDDLFSAELALLPPR